MTRENPMCGPVGRGHHLSLSSFSPLLRAAPEVSSPSGRSQRAPSHPAGVPTITPHRGAAKYPTASRPDFDPGAITKARKPMSEPTTPPTTAPAQPERPPDDRGVVGSDGRPDAG